MASNSGESVMDVLARMKTELSFDVDEVGQTVETPARSAAPASAAPAPVATQPTLKSQPSPAPSASVVSSAAGTAEAADPVDELNSYMGAPLNRYGKGAAAAAAATAAATVAEAAESTKSALPQRKPREVASLEEASDATEATAAKDSTDAAQGSSDSDELPTELCLLEQQEFKPRKRAPEEKACIDAMRELAVHSARRALQTFDNKRRGLDAKHRLGLAFVAFVTSGVAFAFADEVFSLLGLVAICGVATGSMFVVNWQQTVALLKKGIGNG